MSINRKKRNCQGGNYDVPQNTWGTLKRMFSHMKEQRIRLIVVTISIVFYVGLSIWNPMYSAKVVDMLWQSIQKTKGAGNPLCDYLGTYGKRTDAADCSVSRNSDPLLFAVVSDVKRGRKSESDTSQTNQQEAESFASALFRPE